MASRNFTKALRGPARQLASAPRVQQRTFVAAARSAARVGAVARPVAAGPVQQQVRGVKTIDFAGHKEDVYERADWPQEKLLEYFKNDTLALIGYGSQGHGQGLNLRDNGLNVIVGVRKNGKSWKDAEQDGWVAGKNLFDVDEAISRGTIVMNLLSDAAQSETWPAIKPQLVEGKTLYFSHGFSPVFKDLTKVEVPSNIDVILCAPKGSGRTVRSLFREGRGINSSFAVYQDVTGKAEEKAIALGVAIGSGYLYKTTFEKEVYSDLYGERGCLMGGIHGMFLAQYEVLRERGHSPSEAFNETVEEATQSLYPLIGANGMDWMYEACSTTARRGAIDWSPRFKDALKPVFNSLYDAVKDGSETKRSLEYNSQPDYREKYEAEMKEIRDLEIWRAGKAVRSLRPENQNITTINMADLSTTPPLTRESVIEAHKLISPYVHFTPVLTNQTITKLASTPRTAEELEGTRYADRTPARPVLRLWFKCENLQRIGAFKARGAFHAIERLKKEPGWLEGGGKEKGVVTHSSGNHAQALALAARESGIKAHIVMPEISNPKKIAGTKGYGARVIFSGSTSTEREAMAAKVIAETGARLVPPYDHPDILLGQGTIGLEFQQQVSELMTADAVVDGQRRLFRAPVTGRDNEAPRTKKEKPGLDAIMTPCGGGGMLSGVALSCEGTGIRVFGSEPSFEGADDAKRGFESGTRITTVKTLTVADGLRTPVGEHPWSVIYGRRLVSGMYSVTEEEILAAMKLVFERFKLVVEPSACVPLAVALFDEEFRSMVEREAGEEGWDLGLVFSGGNIGLDAVGKLFEDSK
ncbi:pyridoxal-phosphate dependent enzyme-domain-containing protein [Fusarium oxysporum]|nr:pyridoxal-phosphate dependent enzyme-domain-containing protein [Fusarium oxysporum]